MEDFIVVPVEEESPDGGAFDKKIPWDQRAQNIKSAYPSTAKLDWYRVFSADPAIFAKVYQDIMKMEKQSTGRPGKRPAVAPEDAEQYLRRYQNDDYTILEFKDAFRLLKGDRSFRAMGHKCGLTNSTVQRLLDGRARPSAEIMESVARAFKKHPAYFMEYRIAYIVAMLTYRMEQIPEASIVPYMKLRGDAEKEWR